MSVTPKFLPDGNSDVVPPDPIPNSEVKRVSGDGSVGFPHVRVAHRQAPNSKEARSFERAFCVKSPTKLVVKSGKNKTRSENRVLDYRCLNHHLSNAYSVMLSGYSLVHQDSAKSLNDPQTDNVNQYFFLQSVCR